MFFHEFLAFQWITEGKRKIMKDEKKTIVQWMNRAILLVLVGLTAGQQLDIMLVDLKI